MTDEQQKAIWDEENRDMEILKLFEKESADDKFRDRQEMMAAWDYFKAGYLAATAPPEPPAAQSPALTQSQS